MGYTTEFFGKFSFDHPLDDDTYTLLKGLSETRRMKRNIEGYGVDGEFYIHGPGMMGQGHEDNIVDYNRPPSTQPGLWCQWKPTDDRLHLKWDGSEKFYFYKEWIEYLINSVTKPRGYVLNGSVKFRGEDFGDVGILEVVDNQVFIHYGSRNFSVN